MTLLERLAGPITLIDPSNKRTNFSLSLSRSFCVYCVNTAPSRHLHFLFMGCWIKRKTKSWDSSSSSSTDLGHPLLFSLKFLHSFTLLTWAAVVVDESLNTTKNQPEVCLFFSSGSSSSFCSLKKINNRRLKITVVYFIFNATRTIGLFVVRWQQVRPLLFSRERLSLPW